MLSIPTFRGYPQSMLVKVTEPGIGIDLWQWGATHDRLVKDLDVINLLVASGFEHLPREDGKHRFACLMSQCCETPILETPGDREGKNAELWARTEDIQHVDQCPVILAFQVNRSTASNIEMTEPVESELANIPMLPFLPPPVFGEYALITELPQKFYHISQLPWEAQQLWQSLNGTIASLAAPATEWMTYAQGTMSIVAQPVVYHRLLTNLRSELLRRGGQGQTKEAIERLERAYEAVQKIRACETKPEWTILWPQIQRMAKELAQAYYAFHQAQRSAAAAAAEATEATEATEAKKRTIPPTPDLFTGVNAPAPSALPVQAVIFASQDAASGAGNWQALPGHAPFYTHMTEAGSTIVEFMRDENEILTDQTSISLWKQVQEFTDLDGDYLFIMLMSIIKGPLDEQKSCWVYAGGMLDARGIQPIMKADKPDSPVKRQAGHRQEDKMQAAQCVGRAANLWVTIDQWIEEEKDTTTSRRRRRYKRKQFTHKGKFLHIEEVIYQSELSSSQEDMTPTELHLSKGHDYPIAWRIRPGTWLQTFLDRPNRHIAYLCQQALRYDPHNEMWEKRLARYFFFHIRMNAAGGGAFNREIGKLLGELSLPIDRRWPERTRQRFEKAMNRLVRDQQIDAWEYTQNINYRARKWINTWLANKIRIYVAPPLQQINRP